MTKKASITVHGTHWCPDCRRSKQFLGEHQIPYNWVDIEQDKEAEQYVLEKNDGKRIIPAIEFADGSVLVEPSNAELAAKLGLKTAAERAHYELIIVGGGPARLTAALYTAREGIDTLVIEPAAIGGQAAATQWLDNVPGFAGGIEGIAFADQMYRQAQRFDVEFLQAQDVVNVVSQDNYHRVSTADGSEYSARALLIATGSTYRRLGTPGEEDYIGAGIHFCATCDGPFYKGQHVGAIGGGNSATEESVFAQVCGPGDDAGAQPRHLCSRRRAGRQHKAGRLGCRGGCDRSAAHPRIPGVWLLSTQLGPADGKGLVLIPLSEPHRTVGGTTLRVAQVAQGMLHQTVRVIIA